VTEIAPHVGRRARREAEARHPISDTEVHHTAYPTDDIRNNPPDPGQPGRRAYPATTPDSSPGGHGQPAGRSAPSGWYPEANGFAPPGARPPSAPPARPASGAERPRTPSDVHQAPASGYDRNGYRQSGYDQSGYRQNGYRQNGYDQSGYDQNGYRP